MLIWINRPYTVNTTVLVFFIAVAIGYFAFSFTKTEDPLSTWSVQPLSIKILYWWWNRRKEIHPQYPFITGPVKRIVLDDPEDFDDEFAFEVCRMGEWSAAI